MGEFESLDFKILDFINSNSPANIETIKKHFSDIDSVDYRVDVMSKPKYDPTGKFLLKNSSFLVQQYDCVHSELGPHFKKTGVYSITDYGKKTLQNYKKQTKEARKELWLKNAWIPILVSIATNLVINALKQLWPLIQRLASNFL